MRDALEKGLTKATGDNLVAFSRHIETLKASKVVAFRKGQYLSFTNDPATVPWIEPEDVANAVLYLASEKARYVTGSQFVIDAGLLTR